MPWQIDPMHTQVEFAVKHFGMMTVRGRFNDVKASGTVDPGEPEKSRFEVKISIEGELVEVPATAGAA